MARVLVVDHEARLRLQRLRSTRCADAAMDGWATLELLRMERPSTRVLMMSDNDGATLAAERGAEAFLWKPYRPADVLRVVANAMGETPGQSSRRAA